MPDNTIASPPTRRAFLAAVEAVNNLTILCRDDPGVDTGVAAVIIRCAQDLVGCDWPVLGYDVADPPMTADNTDSVKYRAWDAGTGEWVDLRTLDADALAGWLMDATEAGDSSVVEAIREIGFPDTRGEAAKRDSDDINAVRAARDEWRRRAERAEHDLDHMEAVTTGSKFITVHGIRVSRDAYAAAPEPEFCPGWGDDHACDDDRSNPCKACFLYDEQAEHSRWWDIPGNDPNGATNG